MVQEIKHITAADVAAALRNAGLNEGANVYFHSMLIGFVEKGSDTVIDALLDVVGPNGTIVMPAFTWRAVPDVMEKPILQENSLIWTGRITARFLEYPGVKRDRHPMWSNACLGPLSDELIDINERDIFAAGKDKVQYRMYEKDGSTIMFACSFKSCSSMYVIHDIMDIPYRRPLMKRRGTSVDDYLKMTPEEQYAVVNFGSEYLSGKYRLPDFAAIEEPLRNAGVLMEAPIGRRKIMHVTLRDLYKTMQTEHERDPDLLFPPAVQ